jgi:hypothetical protein
VANEAIMFGVSPACSANGAVIQQQKDDVQTSDANGDSDGLDAGDIAGIAIGTFAAVKAVGMVAWCVVRHRKKKTLLPTTTAKVEVWNCICAITRLLSCPPFTQTAGVVD